MRISHRLWGARPSRTTRLTSGELRVQIWLVHRTIRIFGMVLAAELTVLVGFAAAIMGMVAR